MGRRGEGGGRGKGGEWGFRGDFSKKASFPFRSNVYSRIALGGGVIVQSLDKHLEELSFVWPEV